VRMRHVMLLALALVFVFAMASYMFTYSVRFTESAVLTRFGKADEKLAMKEPGLHFKWPRPIEDVTKYDTRVRIVQTRGETQQTSDEKTLIIESFCLWRVDDPYTFFTRYGNAGERPEDHYEQARDELRARLRGALTLTGRYSLGELFAKEQSRLPDLEADMLARLRGGGEDAALDELGIEIVDVGIERVLLSNSITEKVIARMQANRNRIAKEFDSRGNAEAEAIRETANRQAETILAFVREWASTIRARGDRAAAGALAKMTERPDLAVFLKNLDLWREAFSRQITLVFSDGTPGFNLLRSDALSDLAPGEIPVQDEMRMLESSGESGLARRDPGRAADAIDGSGQEDRDE